MTDTQANTSMGLLKRYGILAYGAFGTMADVGLMVLGAILVGLAVAVAIGGFGLMTVTNEDLSTGEMLVSAIVLAVMGAFCLGVASEGPLGRGRRLVGFKLWEVGIGRTLAVFLVGLIGLLIFQFVGGLVEGVPTPIFHGLEVMRVTGVVGMTVMPLVGVPLSLAFRAAPDSYAWLRSGDLPVMFVVWAVAVFVQLS